MEVIWENSRKKKKAVKTKLYNDMDPGFDEISVEFVYRKGNDR